MSLVLRHQPQEIDLVLDAKGWAAVDELLEKLAAKGFALDREALRHVVATNNKKRFAFNEDGTKIRASQGHSLAVELGYQPAVPPPVLYHGTATQNLAAILKTGLEKRSRQHVHLSADRQTAITVGRRHGKPVVLAVAAGQMHNEGFLFFCSENGVWLTEAVPAIYLTQAPE